MHQDHQDIPNFLTYTEKYMYNLHFDQYCFSNQSTEISLQDINEIIKKTKKYDISRISFSPEKINKKYINSSYSEIKLSKNKK